MLNIYNFQSDEAVTADDLFDDIDGMDDEMLAATADDDQGSDGEANMDEVEKLLFDENSKGICSRNPCGKTMECLISEEKIFMMPIYFDITINSTGYILAAMLTLWF